MWLVRRAWSSYAGLWVLSLLSGGAPVVQRLLVLTWMVYMWILWRGAIRSGRRLLPILTLTLLSQCPGIILTLMSMWSVSSGRWGEWPNGLMEMWFQPFVPLLELLPARKVGTWSDMYLEACLVPVVILLFCWICTSFTRNRRSWA